MEVQVPGFILAIPQLLQALGEVSLWMKTPKSMCLEQSGAENSPSFILQEPVLGRAQVQMATGGRGTAEECCLYSLCEVVDALKYTCCFPNDMFSHLFFTSCIFQLKRR